jgi:hypothetical protein
MMIDEGLANLGERQAAEMFNRGIERDGAVANAGQQVTQAIGVEGHATHRATGRDWSDSE